MDNENLTVPYIVYESAMVRAERRDKWLILVIVIDIILLVASNIAWMICWNQYDYVTDDYSISADQSGDGVNIVGGGDIEYESTGNDSKEKDNEDT